MAFPASRLFCKRIATPCSPGPPLATATCPKATANSNACAQRYTVNRCARLLRDRPSHTHAPMCRQHRDHTCDVVSRNLRQRIRVAAISAHPGSCPKPVRRGTFLLEVLAGLWATGIDKPLITCTEHVVLSFEDSCAIQARPGTCDSCPVHWRHYLVALLYEVP